MAFCRVPDCADEAYARMLCAPHYQQAYRLVEKGKTAINSPFVFNVLFYTYQLKKGALLE